jgi:putative oxidoreductase
MKALSYVAPVGRTLLGLIFVLSGVMKFVNWEGSAGYMTAKGLPMVPVLLALAAIVEVVGGICVIIGYRTDVSAVALFLYLIPVTLVFHNFWGAQGMEAQMQMANFLKNLSIMGGLLTLAVTSPTHVSVDEARSRRHPHHAIPTT